MMCIVCAGNNLPEFRNTCEIVKYIFLSYFLKSTLLGYILVKHPIWCCSLQINPIFEFLCILSLIKNTKLIYKNGYIYLKTSHVTAFKNKIIRQQSIFYHYLLFLNHNSAKKFISISLHFWWYQWKLSLHIKKSGWGYFCKRVFFFSLLLHLKKENS